LVRKLKGERKRLFMEKESSHEVVLKKITYAQRRYQGRAEGGHGPPPLKRNIFFNRLSINVIVL
jgi:hypothetical protein